MKLDASQNHIENHRKIIQSQGVDEIDGLALDNFSKFPLIFAGEPQLLNVSHRADRIG